MNVYTDEGNINCLKQLIAAELSAQTINVVEKKPDDKVVPYLSTPVFPVLQTASNNYIFSSNAATQLLLGSQNEGDLGPVLDEWLEWEATQLQPVVHALLLSGSASSKSAELVTVLNKLLRHLEQTTQNNPQSLTGASISLADIVVWCSLLPLCHEGAPIKDVLAAFPHVQQWFQGIHQVAAVVTAIKKLPGGLNSESIKLWSQAHTPVPLSGAAPTRRVPTPGVTSGTSKAGAEPDNAVTLPSVTPEEVKLAEEAWNSGKSQVASPKERKHPILPKVGERNILVTSALPYVNNVPHLGNIIGCVLSADVFSRFCRLMNHNILYICGTDEYGTATETKAIEEGLTPQQICDKYNKLHTEIYEWFNIDFDYFGRTTTREQTDIAQEIFWDLHKRDYILQDSIEQLQCVKCNRFLADRFVEGTCPLCAYDDARGDQCDKCGKLINAVELINPRCKQCQSTPIVKSSRHLFMDLPKLQPLLEKHLNSSFEVGLWSHNTKVITKSWIRDGLKPRCISRDLKWGTPVPLEGFTDKVFYVWYDAPIGYISITANYTEHWEKWWKNPKHVDYFNFMAKDNVPFHSVIFPSTLLGTGQNWTVVNNISATEYLNYEDGKFSKSRGVGVFGNDAQLTGIPADVWRFYLLFVRPESQDSCFSWDDFLIKNNSELLNNLGNFINRALMFVSNNFSGTVPDLALQLEDKELIALVNRELQAYLDNLNNIKLRDGLRNILTISRYGNQYMQANQPWVKVKGTAEEKSRAGTIVGLAANIACLLSVMIEPYMPNISQTIQTQLAAPAECQVLHDHFVPFLLPGHKIGKPSPLFQKIDPATIKELKVKFAGTQSERDKPKDATAAATTASPEEIEKLNKAITEQGNVVRKLKEEKKEKSVIDKEVAKLLDLKKQIAAAQGTAPASGGAGGKKNSKQKAKAGKVENGPAANKAAPSGGATPTGNVNPAEVERLTKEVADKGDEVRRLKTEKADKSAVDKSIADLLSLKRQLAVAQGLDPEALTGGASKKKGKKK